MRRGLGYEIALVDHPLQRKIVWDQFRYHRSPSRSAFYEKEGHFILRKHLDNDKEIYCHFDAAPLGYLSIAAHGHADALSVIVHIDGYPFLVDPGTYAYHTHAEWRKYFVSTLAHNTVTINNADQAVHSGPTLWLNHYKASILKAKSSNEFDVVSATHNGYRKEKVNHTRSVEFNKEKDYLKISDLVEGRKSRLFNKYSVSSSSGGLCIENNRKYIYPGQKRNGIHDGTDIRPHC